MILCVINILLMTCVMATDAVWHQVWADEFDGVTLDLSKWKFETGCHGWGNWELECYTANRSENVWLENGKMVIRAVVEQYNGKNFTSVRLNSRSAWKFGKFETRARLAKGRNLWPAIWMMPQNNTYGIWPASGEIDIMEYRGEVKDITFGTLHYSGGNCGTGDKNFGIDLSESWHTYGIEWNKTSISWLFDGNVTHTQNINKNMFEGQGQNPYTQNGQPFDQPFYWIINLAVGGMFFPEKWYGPPVTAEEAKNNWLKPTLEIDYIRVFQ